MRPKDQLSKSTLQKRFYPFLVLFMLALCLASAGVVIVYHKSALKGQNQALRSRSTSEASPVNAPVKPREGDPRRVEKAELPVASGRQVYLDSLTGKIGVPPPGSTNPSRLMSLEEENALSSSSEGLVQIPLTGPAGGVKIDLQGRFRSQVVVTIDSQSNPSVRCVTSTTGPEDLPVQRAANTFPGASLNKGTHPEK